MKKALLGTSAIALAGVMAAPANAADWDVRVGGYYNATVAYAQTNGNGVPVGAKFNGVDTKSNAEIHFLPSITLDNGIRIGARIELEGLTDGDQIDESFVFIDGSFGRVNIGSENSAGYLMHYAAPNAAIIAFNSPSTFDYIAINSDGLFRGSFGTTFLEVARNNDAQRITYFTPRFAGFQLGVSYARDGRQDDNSQVNKNGVTSVADNTLLNTPQGETTDIFDIGANYVQTFGDFNVAASARWGTGSQASTPAYPGLAWTPATGVIYAYGGPTGVALGGGNSLVAPSAAVPGGTPQVYGFGLNLGYAGFTLGGSWAEENNINGGVDDGTAWDVGVRYDTGPWGFSFTYFNGRNGEPTRLTPAGAVKATDKQQTYGVGINYALAKGVRLNAFGAYANYDAGAGTAADRDGWLIGTGIGLNF